MSVLVPGTGHLQGSHLHPSPHLQAGILLNRSLKLDNRNVKLDDKKVKLDNFRLGVEKLFGNL